VAVHRRGLFGPLFRRGKQQWGRFFFGGYYCLFVFKQ
jgi:hypothetical protein